MSSSIVLVIPRKCCLFHSTESLSYIHLKKLIKAKKKKLFPSKIRMFLFAFKIYMVTCLLYSMCIGVTLRRRIKQAVQQLVENVKSLAETISQHTLG